MKFVGDDKAHIRTLNKKASGMNLNETTYLKSKDHDWKSRDLARKTGQDCPMEKKQKIQRVNLPAHILGT